MFKYKIYIYCNLTDQPMKSNYQLSRKRSGPDLNFDLGGGWKVCLHPTSVVPYQGGAIHSTYPSIC